jgi:hypothetical protein
MHQPVPAGTDTSSKLAARLARPQSTERPWGIFRAPAPLRQKAFMPIEPFPAGYPPSQVTPATALVGLLTSASEVPAFSSQARAKGSACSRQWPKREGGLPTSTVTAAGPSRTCTGVPCSSNAQEGRPTTNAVGDKRPQAIMAQIESSSRDSLNKLLPHPVRAYGVGPWTDPKKHRR